MAGSGFMPLSGGSFHALHLVPLPDMAERLGGVAVMPVLVREEPGGTTSRYVPRAWLTRKDLRLLLRTTNVTNGMKVGPCLCRASLPSTRNF